MTIDYITIDGTNYNVPVTEIDRSADFLYKFAERTNDGKLKSELIGVYFNYTLKFGKASPSDYAALWDKLTEPVEFHTVIVPDEDGDFTFSAYFAGVRDKIKRVDGTTRYWHGLTVSFIAQEPARV